PARERPSAPSRILVYVAGAVVRPGVYALGPGERIGVAIRAAGGMTAQADAVAVNLAGRLQDGEEIAVPAKDEAPAARSRRTAGKRLGHVRSHRGHEAAGVHHRQRRKTPLESIDLNAADAAALATLPGIGPSLAERIVRYRDENGPFDKLDDLLDVAGTSPRLIDELAPYVVLERR
ncbi:MAG TPA: helix-hairpin-helix domain-containing protein, partial [Candidatus Baltobacteraceae bacterium]|nr:helix-hairpin-helix domain-containing protein [Candidatus Baltobacteraceae bacterium]